MYLSQMYRVWQILAINFLAYARIVYCTEASQLCAMVVMRTSVQEQHHSACIATMLSKTYAILTLAAHLTALHHGSMCKVSAV